MATVATLARQMAEQFETATRADGATFLRLRSPHPEWMADVVRAAHDDMLPDDWRYRMVADALALIVDAADPDGDVDLDDVREGIDGDVSVYTSDLTDWLGTLTTRIGYCDEALENGAHGNSITQVMQQGQYAEREEVCAMVLDALKERAEAEEGASAD